jgi:eukaryotic-like serine/threonine-protein kinase
VIRLPTAAITALRNRLRDRGVRPSISVPTAVDDALDQLIVEHYGPLCEAMYVMMAADGQISGAERDVIRGALRELDDRIRSRHVETLVAQSAENLARDGRGPRLAAIAEAIGEDVALAEAAVLLAAAVAYADGEIADAEDAVMLELLDVLHISHDRMRELLASLERVDTVLERDKQADVADVMIHAALRLRTPEDFERLAATPDRPDVSLALRLYAAFVHSNDDLVDRSTHPRSIPTASVAALRVLAEGLDGGRSAKLEELRSTLVELVDALEAIDKCTALRPARVGIGAVEKAVTRLADVGTRSLERLGKKVVRSEIPRGLEALIEAAMKSDAERPSLGVAVDRLIEAASLTVPGAILATVGHVLRRLPSLPVERPSAQIALSEEAALPEWLPQSRQLGGWYVLKSLGGGGAGSVFVVTRAEDREGERYALKVPLYDAVAARSVSESEYLRVFKLEAGALLALPDHPNIAEFVTFDARARPKPLLVMELVKGTDCQELLAAHDLDNARVIKILDGVLAGLLAMHDAGVGHLDIKPSNVVLRPTGEAVLVDFGLAGRHIRVGCATPFYASPEVWGHNEEGVSVFTADAYSFGCVAYEMFTGKRLFEGSHVLMLMAAHFDHDGKPEGVQKLCDDPDLSPLGEWIASALRRSPKDRANIETLRAKLKELGPKLNDKRWPVTAAG